MSAPIAPQPPHVIRPGVPLGLSALIMQAIEKSPHAPYQSAVEMQDELRGVQALLTPSRTNQCPHCA